jgi:hypothetical protein
MTNFIREFPRLLVKDSRQVVECRLLKLPLETYSLAQWRTTSRLLAARLPSTLPLVGNGGVRFCGLPPPSPHSGKRQEANGLVFRTAGTLQGQHPCAVRGSKCFRLQDKSDSSEPGLGTLIFNERSHDPGKLTDGFFSGCCFLFYIDGNKESPFPEAQPARTVKGSLPHVHSSSVPVVGENAEAL